MSLGFQFPGISWALGSGLRVSICAAEILLISIELEYTRGTILYFVQRHH